MRQYAALLVLFTLTACGDRQPPPAVVHPPDARLEVLEKAQKIEGMLDDISAEQRRQIDQQTR